MKCEKRRTEKAQFHMFSQPSPSTPLSLNNNIKKKRYNRTWNAEWCRKIICVHWEGNFVWSSCRSRIIQHFTRVFCRTLSPTSVQLKLWFPSVHISHFCSVMNGIIMFRNKYPRGFHDVLRTFFLLYNSFIHPPFFSPQESFFASSENKHQKWKTIRHSRP